MKKLVITICMLASSLAFAEPSATCKDLQTAEGSIVSLKYYGAKSNEARKFCYFVSRAVSSEEGKKIGLDGSLMGSIEYCAQGTKADLGSLVKEVSAAIKEVPDCYSEMGQ